MRNFKLLLSKPYAETQCVRRCHLRLPGCDRTARDEKDPRVARDRGMPRVTLYSRIAGNDAKEWVRSQQGWFARPLATEPQATRPSFLGRPQSRSQSKVVVEYAFRPNRHVVTQKGRSFVSSFSSRRSFPSSILIQSCPKPSARESITSPRPKGLPCTPSPARTRPARPWTVETSASAVRSQAALACPYACSDPTVRAVTADDPPRSSRANHLAGEWPEAVACGSSSDLSKVLREDAA